MLNKERKTYKRLCDELLAVQDEILECKQGNTYDCKQRVGLWKDSTYLDELLYICTNIEKDIIPHEIVLRMKFYKELNNKLPMDTITHIASFGDLIDISASNFLEEGIEARIDAVDPC